MRAAHLNIIFTETSAVSTAYHPWKPCGGSYLITWYIIFPQITLKWMNSLAFHLSITQTGPSRGVPAWTAPLETLFITHAPSWVAGNQRTSFPWGKMQRRIFPGHRWVWCWDMEIHILQLLQRLSQVGEGTKALKQQHRGNLHPRNCLYKKLN